jgi:AraC-like DNA-binding protein
MKNCFRGVYGTSIYAYVRSCRMNRAAVLLKTTEKSIACIAGEVGYNSPSKFTAAFKDIMKTTPLEYRKSSL